MKYMNFYNNKNNNNTTNNYANDDSVISESKEYLKVLNNLKEENIQMTKGINNCINLLRKSAKGEIFNKRLNYYSDENIGLLHISLSYIDSEKEATYNKIKEIENNKES